MLFTTFLLLYLLSKTYMIKKLNSKEINNAVFFCSLKQKRFPQAPHNVLFWHCNTSVTDNRPIVWDILQKLSFDIQTNSVFWHSAQCCFLTSYEILLFDILQNVIFYTVLNFLLLLLKLIPSVGKYNIQAPVFIPIRTLVQ